MSLYIGEDLVSGVVVGVSAPQPTLQTKTATPSETQQTISPDSSYDGLSSVTVGAISSTYVGSGVTKQSAKTVTPSASEQTAVNSGVYTIGIVKVAAVSTETKSISENGTYTPTNGKFFSSVTVNVPQSGGGMNVQCYHGMGSVKTTSYSATGVSLTVAKSGTYKVSWMGCRNTTSGTSGSQLYINNSAYGSAQTSFTSSYGQSIVLNNVSLTTGQTIEVRARARSTSYVMMVGNLCIEQTA